jgi:hypothetical protein
LLSWFATLRRIHPFARCAGWSGAWADTSEPNIMKTKPALQIREIAGCICVAALLTSAVQSAPLVADDFESGSGKWQPSGTWGLTTLRSASPSHSATDTPGAYYTNNNDSSLTLAATFSLASPRPALAFKHAYELENAYDFGRVEISTDGGASWSPTPLASYSGTQAAMSREQLDLTSFAAQTQVKVRFRMTTDSTVVMDGWYLDDVVIGSAPLAVTLHTPTGAELGQTHVTLRWSASSDPDFASYVILRGTQAGFDWRTAKTVATLSDSATVEFTDIAVAPKSNYRYRVMVLNNTGLHSLSNEVTAATPAGMDYPFLDDGEAGPNYWTAASPWALSDEDFHSPGHAWSDSPGGNYADNIASQPLTLAAPLNLTSAANPVLTFHHRHSLASGDTANVEISTNQGSSWTSLATYTTGTLPWNQARIPLTSYAGQPSMLVRFRLTTNASDNSDGWHIDDISVADSPATVASPAVDQITSHTLRLTWNANSSLPFSHYAIHRSTSPGIGINSPRVAVITNQAQTQFIDTGLALDTLYYYRIYAVSPYGTYSADSANETVVRTLNNPLPFAENFDETLLSWNTGAITGTSAWGLSTEVKRSGVAALGSSPGTSYAQNIDTYIETAVDLRGTEWPVLSFWDRYGLNSGDWIRLEISATGGPTIYPYGTYESSRSEWRQQRIDLSQWKGLGNVKLRFRLASDNAPTPGEGWFIDDLTVSENPNRNNPLTPPFTEDFESGATGWLLCGWTAQPDATAIDGGNILGYGRTNLRSGLDTQHWAVLDRPVVLPAGSNVQSTFWLRGRLDSYAYFRLLYSADGGVSWPELSVANRDAGYNTNGAWERCQASLAPLAGQTVRLRFYANGNSYAPVTDVSVDKLTLAQMPAAVALTSAVPALRSVILTWDATSLGGNFARYEVWRSASANVSVTNGQKIFEATNPATLTCTDGGLNIGGTYYYKVFTVDNRDTFIPSNELSATTVPVVLPFADTMDSMNNWVSGTNNSIPSTWAVNPNNKQQGTASLATVPVGQYAQNIDSYIETAVDLRGTEWPVLSFWDRYGLNSGDWIRLEISATGGPTIYPYGTYESSRSEWRQQRIDLSQWKGLGNVKLRFRLASDNAPTPGEGWFIDDLTVSENPNRNNPLTPPFTEDFESGATGWLLCGWTAQPDATAIDGGNILGYGRTNLRSGLDTQHWAVLDRPVVLPAGSNVQSTFWLRGRLDSYAYFRLLYSADGGVSWPELSVANRDAGYNTNGAWERCQASLAPLAGQTVRLRFYANGNSYAPVTDVSVDKLTLAQMPAAVAMQPIDAVGVTSMRLNWTSSPLATFRRYEIYRSTAASVSNASTLVGTIHERETASFSDTGLDSRIQYFYRVYVVDDRDTYSPSEVVSAITLGMPLPLADDFESARPGWSFTGQWQLQNGVGRNGGAALVDSSGDYLASSDTHARFAVNLNGTQWPVLRFWDRHNFAGTSWGRVEISTDGVNWSWIVYGVSEIRETWQMQEIDLSPWKNQVRVFIRFRCGTDGSLADGWAIDDLSVSDRAAESIYPFFDGFESGTGQWLAGSWTGVGDTPHTGSAAVQDTVNRRNPPDTPNYLTLAREVDLTNAADPTLTFFIRGTLGAYSWFRVQISTDGGLTWPDISTLNRDTGFNSAVWLKQQASLAAWKGSKIRIRFNSGGNGYQPASDIFLDNIGIGEAAPGAPALVSPFEGQTVEIIRPTLTVGNAIDYQSDALTHEFEVYADAGITQRVAHIPSVASGVTSTSWQVDVDLPDHAPYWWRARASDGINTGQWSNAVVFNINEFNNPPLPVMVAGPANDSLLIDGNGLLVWFQSLDPDLGDQVRDYQIQIDNDYQFGSPEVDSSGITVDSATYGPGFLASVTLADLPGTALLPSGRWFWRIRARDSRFANGAWSTGYAYFRLPTLYQRYLRSLYPDPDWFLYNVTNPAADPDGNGVGVLMEFACGIAPGAEPGDRLPRPIEVTIEGERHQGFEWTRRKVSELGFLLEVSGNLTYWQSDDRGAVEILHPIDASSERVRIIDPDPVGSHGTRFIRMRVRE